VLDAALDAVTPLDDLTANPNFTVPVTVAPDTPCDKTMTVKYMTQLSVTCSENMSTLNQWRTCSDLQ